jgi:hypothetical protein
MSFEAALGMAAVRYASVDAGFRSPSGPRTVGEPATDEHGPAHGRARTSPRTTAEKATDGAGGSGYDNRPTGFLALTWHFRIPIHYHHLPRRWTRTRTRTRTRWPLLHPAQRSRFPMERLVLSGTPVVAVARLGWVSDVGARDTGRKIGWPAQPWLILEFQRRNVGGLP